MDCERKLISSRAFLHIEKIEYNVTTEIEILSLPSLSFDSGLALLKIEFSSLLIEVSVIFNISGCVCDSIRLCNSMDRECKYFLMCECVLFVLLSALLLLDSLFRCFSCVSS